MVPFLMDAVLVGELLSRASAFRAREPEEATLCFGWVQWDQSVEIQLPSPYELRTVFIIFFWNLRFWSVTMPQGHTHLHLTCRLQLSPEIRLWPWPLVSADSRNETKRNKTMMQIKVFWQSLSSVLRRSSVQDIREHSSMRRLEHSPQVFWGEGEFFPLSCVTSG